MRALNSFSQASGLHVNKDKSAIYFGNVKRHAVENPSSFRFLEGYISFRYLGVPITTKRIAKADCDLLVDRMLRRILCWTSRHLLYAARIVHVNSVLLSIHT